MQQNFGRLIDAWGLIAEEARQLLGQDLAAPLTPEAERRIRLLLQIRLSLHGLYGPTLADRWVQIPNSNPLFGGRRPLDHMIAVGSNQVARLLAARAA